MGRPGRAADRLGTWDAPHGKIEAFNERGKHLGAPDAVDSRFIEDAVTGRGSMSGTSGPEAFFVLRARGDVSAEEINDHVDRWHEGDRPGGQPPHDHPGSTREECAARVEEAPVLPSIRFARSTGQSLADVLPGSGDEYRMAARVPGPFDGVETRAWLEKQRGRHRECWYCPGTRPESVFIAR